MENLPPDNSDSETLRNIRIQAEDFLKENQEYEATSSIPANMQSNQEIGPDTLASDINGLKLHEHKHEETIDSAGLEQSQDSGNSLQEGRPSVSSPEAAGTPKSLESGSQSSDPMRPVGEVEVIEQFEPGVFVTLLVSPDGTKVFKRIRFRYTAHFIKPFPYIAQII